MPRQKRGDSTMLRVRSDRDHKVALGIPAKEAGTRAARAIESEPQAGIEELIRLAAVK